VDSFFDNGRLLRSRSIGANYQGQIEFGGRIVRRFERQRPILDSRVSCFVVGLFPLYQVGDQVYIHIVPPQPKRRSAETADFEAYFKVVGRELYQAPAGEFDCLRVEFGFTGIVAMFAPKLTVWVDTQTRRTVAFKGDGKDDNSLHREVIRVGE
jgi:hypothetical protein